MASKVMVKIPVTPFGQVNKSKTGSVNGELVAVTRAQDVSTSSRSPDRSGSSRGPDGVRAAQLEQNIRFLQEQHQLMLAGLHSEIESLRNRNRELQFQLVFMKGTLPSSPSSPEDDTKHKVYVSPKQFNITPLQVEILEKELTELKIHTQEVDCRNVYLSAIVDEQKKKLERYERDREKERERALQPDPELLRKLDDAEAIIRRLRRENSDMRREQSAQTAGGSAGNGGNSRGGSAGGGGGGGAVFVPAVYQMAQEGGPSAQQQLPQQRGGGGGGSGGGNNHHHQGGNHIRGNNGRHRGGNNGSGHYRGGNWFPPLHSQSYWQGRKNGGGQQGMDAATPLPSLQQQQQPGSGGESQHYQSRRGSNNNYHHNGEGRKYRGGGQKGANKPS